MVEVMEGRMGGKWRLVVGRDWGVVAVVVMAQVRDPEHRDLGWLFYILHLLWFGKLVRMDPVLDSSNRLNQKILDKAESKEARKRLMYVTSKELEFAFIISLAKIKEMNLQVFVFFFFSF